MTIPVTLTWSNHASITEVGTIKVVVESSTAVVCGSTTYPVDVPPGSFYDQTQDVTLSSGCSPAGGTVLTTLITNGITLLLPPEPIP